MDIEISSKRENKLLNRTELELTVTHADSPTPKRDEVLELISKTLGTSKEGVVVDSMKSSFGSHQTRVFAKVYQDKESALRIENKHILLRNKLAQKNEGEKSPAKEAAAK